MYETPHAIAGFLCFCAYFQVFPSSSFTPVFAGSPSMLLREKEPQQLGNEKNAIETACRNCEAGDASHTEIEAPAKCGK